MKKAVSIYKNLLLCLLFGLGYTLLLPVRVPASTFPCQPGCFATIGNSTIDPTTYRLQLTPDDYNHKDGLRSNNIEMMPGIIVINKNKMEAYTNDIGRRNSTSLVIHPVLINNIKYF